MRGQRRGVGRVPAMPWIHGQFNRHSDAEEGLTRVEHDLDAQAKVILLFRSVPNDDIKLRELLERFGLIERFTLFGRADLTAVDAATDQR